MVVMFLEQADRIRLSLKGVFSFSLFLPPVNILMQLFSTPGLLSRSEYASL